MGNDNQFWRDRDGSSPDFQYRDVDEPTGPDYSRFSDQDLASSARDYSDPKTLRQDILPDNYKPETFGSRFRDNYRDNHNMKLVDCQIRRSDV